MQILPSTDFGTVGEVFQHGGTSSTPKSGENSHRIKERSAENLKSTINELIVNWTSFVDLLKVFWLVMVAKDIPISKTSFDSTCINGIFTGDEKWTYNFWPAIQTLDEWMTCPKWAATTFIVFNQKRRRYSWFLWILSLQNSPKVECVLLVFGHIHLCIEEGDQSPGSKTKTDYEFGLHLKVSLSPGIGLLGAGRPYSCRLLTVFVSKQKCQNRQTEVWLTRNAIQLQQSSSCLVKIFN